MAKKHDDRILRMDKISHSKMKSLDRKRTFVVATMSPIEVHGPHLPLGQDFMEAYALAERTAEKLLDKRPKWSVLMLPPVPVATDCLPHLGSISFPIQVVRQVAYHLVEPFAKAGFTRIAFTSFHGGPRHLTALEDAALRISNKYDSAAVSLFSAVLGRIIEGDIFLDGIKGVPGSEITKEQLKKDHHAGFVETTLGLALWPELVEDGWEELPPSMPNPDEGEKETNDSYLYGYQGRATVMDKVKQNLATFDGIIKSIKYYRDATYHGYPAMATKEQGEALFDHLTDVCLEVVEEFIDKGKEMDPHSPLWKLRMLSLNSVAGQVIDKLYS